MSRILIQTNFHQKRFDGMGLILYTEADVKIINKYQIRKLLILTYSNELFSEISSLISIINM